MFSHPENTLVKLSGNFSKFRDVMSVFHEFEHSVSYGTDCDGCYFIRCSFSYVNAGKARKKSGKGYSAENYQTI